MKNEIFESEINIMILEVQKLQKRFILFTIITLLGNIVLVLLNFFNVFVLFIFLMMVFMIFITHVLKKRYVLMLDTYQTNREEIITGLENYILAYQNKRKNKLVHHATNALNALKEQV